MSDAVFVDLEQALNAIGFHSRFNRCGKRAIDFGGFFARLSPN
jgi:hypothetical protein